MVVQHLVNILLLGGVYACIGIGFSLIYGVMNMMNLAHGSMIMLGAYAAYWSFELTKTDPFLSLPFIMIGFYFFGFYLQKFAINPVLKSGLFMTMIMTYGLELIFLNLVLYFFKADYRAITSPRVGEGLEFWGTVLPYNRILIFIASLILIIGLRFFLSKTKTGLAIMATALNKNAARLYGVDVDRIYSVTYGISSALAAAGGALIASVYNITPSMEGPMLSKAFVIAVLGGLGDVKGAIVGGIVLALVETAGVNFLGSEFQNLISFVVFVLILVLRPHGLVGKRFFAEIGH